MRGMLLASVGFRRRESAQSIVCEASSRPVMSQLLSYLCWRQQSESGYALPGAHQALSSDDYTYIAGKRWHVARRVRSRQGRQLRYRS